MTSYKYYVAVKNQPDKFYTHVDLIKIPRGILPTEKGYPEYAYMYGGYNTRRKAEQTAMYHNFCIDNPVWNESCKIVLPIESKG